MMTQNDHVCAICCRPEVAGDVIAAENVKTIEGNAALNLEIATFNSILDILKNHFVKAAAATDIDDSIKRKYISVSLNKYSKWSEMG